MELGNVTLKDAALKLCERLRLERYPKKSASFQVPVNEWCDEALLAAKEIPRLSYKSRDLTFQMSGIGTAHETSSLSEVLLKIEKFSCEVFYFGAMRFDPNTAISEEWHGFGTARFILPLVTLTKSSDQCTLSVNYCHEAMPWDVFLVKSINLLSKVAREESVSKRFNNVHKLEPRPSFEHYHSSVTRGIKEILSSDVNKKVVLGRRRTCEINENVDTLAYFLRLQKQKPKGFLFFFDTGDAAFFGASPELLYRRCGNRLFTESLAGTRVRSSDKKQDQYLKNDLLKSDKDNRELQFVSQHIEKKLADLGLYEIVSSSLDVMQLSYVQHLRKTYEGTLPEKSYDAEVIATLHPTPAVSGYERDWALAFIREQEGFDRGLYAGPIGIIGKEISEFAVGIRSALIFRNKLFVYAACGIVEGSDAQSEWQELNNKERSILGIFDNEQAE